jgi:hypothetical protein
MERGYSSTAGINPFFQEGRRPRCGIPPQIYAEADLRAQRRPHRRTVDRRTIEKGQNNRNVRHMTFGSFRPQKRPSFSLFLSPEYFQDFPTCRSKMLRVCHGWHRIERIRSMLWTRVRKQWKSFCEYNASQKVYAPRWEESSHIFVASSTFPHSAIPRKRGIVQRATTLLS